MLKPLGNNVIIEPIVVEKKTASGILLTADSNENKFDEGIVLAVGPGANSYGKIDPMTVKVGDRVIYSAGQYSHSETFKHEGKHVIFMTEDNIWAVVE